jgi:hypothetical protein
MIVKIKLYQTAQALEFDAENAYQKGYMYCVYLKNGKVKKYPLIHIFEVEEDYSDKECKK